MKNFLFELAKMNAIMDVIDSRGRSSIESIKQYDQKIQRLLDATIDDDLEFLVRMP